MTAVAQPGAGPLPVRKKNIENEKKEEKKKKKERERKKEGGRQNGGVPIFLLKSFN